VRSSEEEGQEKEEAQGGERKQQYGHYRGGKKFNRFK